MRLNRDVLRAAYEYLDTTEPFVHWNLPSGEEMCFKIGRSNTLKGNYTLFSDGSHEIYVSESQIKTTDELMHVMAHEMIHLFQAESGMAKGAITHGQAFRKLARRVCKVHGFKYEDF